MIKDWIETKNEKGCVSRIDADGKYIKSIWVDGNKYPLERYKFIKQIGLIKGILFELVNTCGNPNCINPIHFIFKPAEEPTGYEKLDRVVNTSRKFGMKRSHKLTQKQADEIRKSTENNVTLADKYDVSPLTISQIRRGITWNNNKKKTEKKDQKTSENQTSDM